MRSEIIQIIASNNYDGFQHFNFIFSQNLFVGLAYQGKDIVFRFIIEHNSLTDFGPYVINNRSILI
jgi:hypothetical protein